MIDRLLGLTLSRDIRVAVNAEVTVSFVPTQPEKSQTCLRQQGPDLAEKSNSPLTSRSMSSRLAKACD